MIIDYQRAAHFADGKVKQRPDPNRRAETTVSKTVPTKKRRILSSLFQGLSGVGGDRKVAMKCCYHSTIMVKIEVI